MADRDLTPAEARAEVEAFMGEGWRFQVYEYETHDGARPVPCVYCEQANMDGLDFRFTAPTYRAAVDALKAAWRDAVRPVAERGVVFGLADLHHSADPAVVQQEYAKRIPFLTSLSLGEEA